MKTFDHVEYMALARMAALSEVVWRDADAKNFTQFKTNLTQHAEYWASQNVNIANHLLDISAGISTEYKTGTSVEIQGIPDGATVEYSMPNDVNFKPLTQTKITLKEDGKYQFKAVDYQQHAANFAKVKLKNLPHQKYTGNGPTSIFNGIKGSDEKYGDTEWLGFNDGTDFEAQIEFPEKEKINMVALRFFKGEGQWIYLPKRVKISASEDGENYKLARRNHEHKN